MRTDVRNRLFLPLVLPLGIAAFVATLVLLFAGILLWNTKQTAVVIAICAAGGVLFAIAMLTSSRDFSGGNKAVVVGAAAVPVLLGALVAIGVLGAIDDDARNINAQPLVVVPEDAARIAAVNSQEFCAPQNGECTVTEELTVPVDPDAEEVVVVFENREAGVPHNWSVYPFVDGDPDFAQPVFAEPPFPGVATTVYRFAPPDLGEYHFHCDVHPNMQGTVAFAAAA